MQQALPREGSMKALILTIPVVMAFLLSAQAEEKVVKMKLVTKFQQEAGGGAHVFGVTFQQDGTIIPQRKGNSLV
jgi:hypothetical protein